MKAIAQRMDSSHLTKYIESLQSQFSDPDLKQHFPEQKRTDEEDEVDPAKQQTDHKRAMVQQFSLG
jgi:hypothetical protein